jgi:hypothetical protein
MAIDSKIKKRKTEDTKTKKDEQTVEEMSEDDEIETLAYVKKSEPNKDKTPKGKPETRESRDESKSERSVMSSEVDKSKLDPTVEKMVSIRGENVTHVRHTTLDLDVFSSQKFYYNPTYGEDKPGETSVHTFMSSFPLKRISRRHPRVSGL